MARDHPVTLDIVVPVYNEEDALPSLLDELARVFGPDGRSAPGLEQVRVLFVDDGSTDRSAARIAEAIQQGAPARLVRLTRNFGHQNAISAGLDRVDADLAVVMDADLQDPPELVPRLVERWRAGADVVYAQRRHRRENPLKRLGYWGFYRLVAWLAEMRVPVDSGDFCLLGRRVVEAMQALPERLRFPRMLRAWVGFRQEGVAYDRPPRRSGRAKYTLARLYRLATDGIASASIRPLRLAQTCTWVFALLTVGLAVGAGWRLLTRPHEATTFYALLVLCLVSAGNFVITLCLYILGAYVGRTYLEAKGRPPYLVLEEVGPDRASADERP